MNENPATASMSRPMFVGSKLKPIIELWPKVRDVLGIDGVDAVCFVEKTFERLRVTLYLDSEETGLWTPRPFSDDVFQMITDMGVSDFAQRFFNDEVDEKTDREGWDKFRITPRDFNAIIEEATSIANAEPGGEALTESGAEYLNPEHEHYAPKLAAAVAAWEAVTSNPDLLRGTSPKAAMERWLRENAGQYGLLKSDGNPNEQGIEEVTKVANWKIKGGAPATPSR